MSNRKPRGYWNIETCRAEAQKHATMTEFNKAAPRAVTVARANGFLRDICRHMAKTRRGSRKWTKEECLIAAKKFKHRSEFQKNALDAYKAAHRNGWIDETCQHMTPKPRSPSKWTFEICAANAAEYKHRGDFQKGSSGAYQAAKKAGWLDSICKHMEPKDFGLLCAYVILNERLNLAYVGVTNNFKKRMYQHKRSGTDGSTRARKITSEPDTQFCQLTKHTTPPNQARALEELFYKHYANLGYQVLNNTKSLGATGGSEIRWTLSKLRAEAAHFRTRNDFQKNSTNAYTAAYNRGLLDEICAHMVDQRKTKGFWQDKENCRAEALKYMTKTDFQKAAVQAYKVALEEGFLQEICGHMTAKIKPKGYWSKTKIKAIADGYLTKKDFREGDGAAYDFASRNGWLDELCIHMQQTRKPPGYWQDKNNCMAEAKLYNGRAQFKKEAYAAWKQAKKSGWLDEFFPKKERSV